MLAVVNNFCIKVQRNYQKEFENIFKKIKQEDKDFSSQKRDWENFEQNNESMLLMSYLHHKIVKK